MIKSKEAVKTARTLMGTPYEEMDCIGLIREVIRLASGGDTGYRCAGTNWLWDSIGNAGKYRHLSWRQEGIGGARAGMLAFKRQGTDVHHVGLVTGEGTVIHASSEYGETVETPLDGRWDLLAIHRNIAAEEETDMTGESGFVRTMGGRLNVRSSPGGSVIGQLENGSEVQILSTQGEWHEIAYGEAGSGYVSDDYIEKASQARPKLRIIDEEGNVYEPTGIFTVTVGETD